MAFSWNKITIRTETGDMVQGIAPIIVSASRATDIPAFYADWFMNRLQSGYVVWTNPFSGTKKYVSFRDTRVFVFWSKNPKPLIQHLPRIDDHGYNYYFQFTLNDYDLEGLEPNVPSVEQRIDTFRTLSTMLGPDRVVWRFDPLLITDATPPERLLERIKRLGERLYPLTRKLVISFADIAMYRKVQVNLNRRGIRAREFTSEEMHQFAGALAGIASGWGLQVATCAESEDLSVEGISHNKCIDDDLLARCFRHDQKLMSFLGAEEIQEDLFDVPRDKRRLKDKGQRQDCECIVSKDIGQYNTCSHLCAYCYANTSEATVLQNFRHHDRAGESICPSVLVRQ